MSSSQSEEDCKYKHLLQPIRDLAANWDINIANDLEEYLGVLEHLTFSFDGGPNLNFAEAALLIQGSACVYSKKVEHLHGLVHQALSVISDKRQRTEAGGQPTVDDVDEFDDEETFLNLDDVLQEGAGIDLEEGAAAEHEASSRAPTVLLALEDTGQTHGDGSASTYRIAACSVHKSGALLLEDREGQFWDEKLVRLRSAEQPLQQQCTLDDWPWPETDMHGAEQHQSADMEAAPADMGPGFDADDDDDSGPKPLEPMDIPGNEAMTQRQSGAQQAQAGPQRRIEARPAEIRDPYEPLNPHSAGDLPLRPFRKSKPRRKRVYKAPRAEDRPFAAPPPGSLGSLSYPEFGYMLRARQAAQRAQQAASRSQMTNAWVDAPEEDHLHDAENFDVAGEEQCDNDDGFGDDEGYEDGGQAEELSFDDLADAAASGQPNYDEMNAEAPLAAELSYEELCAAHTEARMAAAAAAEVQTELASRVAGWRTKIGPVLEEQDARGDFDIHTMGESLLNDMAAVSLEDPAEAKEAEIEKAPPLAFGAVVKKQHKWQVSRLFSALLQLANNGNIVILRGSNPGQPFQLRLASLEKKHQHFQDYRAPSFLQPRDMNVPEGDSQVTKGVGSPSAQKAEAGSTKAAARKAPPKKKRQAV
ncbi:g890 [Coccomyxa viridis]|uniref:G890 protein n=1 Tax=Coccomyxa viridis TaxID=1274662 RepID=A0ABP1FIE2_9CHLO